MADNLSAQLAAAEAAARASDGAPAAPSPPPTQAAARPVNGFSLLLTVLRERIAKLFKRTT
jgi:hypothetical protein